MTSSVDRFGVECHSYGSEVTVRVVGEVDMATAGVLAARLDRAIKCFNGGVRVNLAGVTFMDSTGLHARCVLGPRSPRSVAGWSSPSRVGNGTACSSWPAYSTPLNWPASPLNDPRDWRAGQHSISTHTCLPAAVGTHPHPSVTAATRRNPHPPSADTRTPIQAATGPRRGPRYATGHRRTMLRSSAPRWRARQRLSSNRSLETTARGRWSLRGTFAGYALDLPRKTTRRRGRGSRETRRCLVGAASIVAVPAPP